LKLQTLAKTVYSFRTARAVSLTVLFALLFAQLVIVVPTIWTQHRLSINDLLSTQRSQLQSTLGLIDLQESAVSQSVLTEQLVGVTFTDPGGNVLFSKGDLPELTRVAAANSERQSNRRGSIDTAWPMQINDAMVSAQVRIDTGNIWLQSLLRLFGLILFVLLTSAVGALVAMWCTVRYFIQPLDDLINALRDSRAKSDGNIPEKVEYTHSDDLNPLAEEFNGLIEAQRKAARQVKVKQQYLEFAAHHDPLTHLPNRLMFEDTLKKTVADAVRNDLQFAVFLVDLDNFKFFNDQYGHLVGDKMVAEVGNRLRTMMRDIDLVARLDGDEFVVIQKDVTDRESAEDVAKRLMNVATAPYEYRGFTLKAAVSVGISCFPLDVHSGQDEEMMGEEIVNNAAVALQEAKSNGKNQYQLFNETMRSRLTARIRLEQDLKLALQEEQFEVYYQPKINIHSRKITGAEALVRWKHPSNGYISPEVFVPVAEEAGMIIELGEWILRTACRQTHMLQQLGYVGLNIAVNISAVQFTDGNLLPMVSKALKDTKLQPNLLELEITESAVMHDPEEVIHSLHELSRFGMRLAIDDFGTGYSSLAYLKRFPVDTLKIDRAFITDISSDNDDVAIVEAVLGLGKHFNMKVVAEGVEDEEQLQFLKSQGCDLAQGFYISRPMNIDSYVDWLKRWPYGVQGADAGSNANVVPIAANGDVSRRSMP